MQSQEKLVIVAVLALVALFVIVDVATDVGEGVARFHVIAEGLVGVLALFGIYYVLRGSSELRQRLAQEQRDFSAFRSQAEAWRAQSRRYIDGLALAIDQQLERWNLTAAEKEVAFLLLKGLSLKEVATVRGTTEKTARVQSMAIYAKAGLSGRSELSAFFLEDLLVPRPQADADRAGQAQ
jgi:DNA-binding CsgD family transcriptional regulator